MSVAKIKEANIISLFKLESASEEGVNKFNWKLYKLSTINHSTFYTKNPLNSNLFPVSPVYFPFL